MLEQIFTSKQDVTGICMNFETKINLETFRLSWKHRFNGSNRFKINSENLKLKAIKSISR